MNKTSKMNYSKEEILTKGGIKLVNYLPDIGINKVREEIYTGLKAFPKYISPKFFYDKRGSELFEAITKLDEYSLTRTEKKILSTIGILLILGVAIIQKLVYYCGKYRKINY